MLHILFMLFIALIIISTIITVYILSLRRVVPTNEVHIVQRPTATLVYGADSSESIGNVYYQVPASIPKYGVVVSKVPSTNFTISIDKYEVFDKNHASFQVGFTFFFRISNYKQAASRIFTINALTTQIEEVIKSALRAEFAKDTYKEIKEKRSEYGTLITEQIASHLKKEWGVVAIKDVEITYMNQE